MLFGGLHREHTDALAEPHLGVERQRQPGEFEPGAHQRLLSGAAAREAHGDLLLHRHRGGWLGGLELRQPGLHGPVPRGHRVAARRLLLQGADELPQPLVLLVVPAVQFFQPADAVRAGPVVGVESTAVHPGPVGLDRDDAGGRRRQQLTVVADEEHGLRRRGKLRLEPALAWDVEEIIRLVQEQQLVVAPQQRFEGQPLLLAAG